MVPPLFPPGSLGNLGPLFRIRSVSVGVVPMREACRIDVQEIAHFTRLAAGGRILQYKEGNRRVLVDGNYNVYGDVAPGVMLARRASIPEKFRGPEVFMVCRK